MPLSVRIDNIGALRSASKARVPDPVQAAVLAELAGADGITAHLREDRAFLKDRDIYLLKETIKTRLNLEIAPETDLVDLALEVKPHWVTFVPLTSGGEIISGGIDFSSMGGRLNDMAARLDGAGVIYSCLINPETEAVKEAARLKCRAVHLAAFEYAGADADDNKALANAIDQTARMAGKLGMTVFCGGGLDYKNIGVLAALGSIDEFVVGHSLLARAVMTGMERAVRDMNETILNFTRENPFV
jgi:pyridoxine 5-phosphate synthase